MDLTLNGKRALVCGSTRGIGKAAAIELAQLGAQITLFARNADLLARVVTELPGDGHDTIAADFSDPQAVGAALGDAMGDRRTYHIVVNNTGGPPGGPAHKADTDAYQTAFRTHVVTNQTILHAVIERMRAAGYGRIINVISTSVKAPIPNLGVSNTIRGAVANWAKTLATELGPDGITVNNVLPGFTDTDRLASILETRAAKEGSDTAAVADAIRATIPARRFATAAEVGAAVAFLATPAAAYISGINLPVDGGRTPAL